MDSGWLDEKDLQTFTPAVNGISVSDPDNYYTVETVGDGMRFTITRDTGMTLLINNTDTGKINTLMNGVFVDRAD